MLLLLKINAMQTSKTVPGRIILMQLWSCVASSPVASKVGWVGLSLGRSIIACKGVRSKLLYFQTPGIWYACVTAMMLDQNGFIFRPPTEVQNGYEFRASRAPVVRLSIPDDDKRMTKSCAAGISWKIWRQWRWMRWPPLKALYLRCSISKGASRY